MMASSAVPTEVLASMLFGRPIAVDGVQEQVCDLGFVRVDETWRVVAVRTKRGEAVVGSWSPGGMTATAAETPAGVTWLREALFDRQIVDLAGRRVTRVGDVVLRGDDAHREIAAVDVGASAVLRRLGLMRLAARVRPRLLPIERLHVAGGRTAAALTLAAPSRELEDLDAGTVTDLLSRLPVATAEDTVRRSRHRDALARVTRVRRRRRRYPRTPG
jgi:hypothetical protein